MLKVHQEPPKPKPASAPVFLALGFRPFFSMAGLAGVVLLLLWLGLWTGAFSAPTYYGLIGWHSHEMLFGYTVAVIAGFLLTAVRNWTGVNTPSGLPLALLAILWLLGRLFPWLDSWVPTWLITGTDLLFLPAVAVALAPALWQGKTRANRIFIPLLLAMAITNLYVHLEATGLTSTGRQGIDAMLFLVVGLVTLLGGRVIPFFTEGVIPGYQAKRYQVIEIVAITLLGAMVLIQLISPSTLITAVLAIGVAVSQFIRLDGWYHRAIWKHPILWVLYSAMAWIIVGFMLLALASMGMLAESLAIHALTLGGIGILTFGMMSRVILGHTGRPIEPHPVISGCFVLLNIAVVIRVGLPVIAPSLYETWLYLSGGIWIGVFSAFCFTYIPMLILPRNDGKPG